MTRKKLGKYEIIDRIGRGGMAEVYRGYHAALDRYVAIKLLHPFLADDPEFKDRFENEARNVAKLKHPNIVQVYDFEYDEEGDSYYMVMEMINGPTLKDRLFDLASSGERLSVAEAIRLVKSASEALAYAHQRNMIHRDVKPANLMIDEDGRVILTDFGIAKIVTGAQFTASGGMVGTPAYMAPEQGLGEAGDERSDIYSMGVILYQLITGRLPYDADTPLAVILKHVNEPLPETREFVPEIAEDLDAIIRKTLAKEPEDRYATAGELAEELGQLDDNGHRYAIFAAGAAGVIPPTDSATVPAAPTSEQRAALRAAAEQTPTLRQAPDGYETLTIPPGGMLTDMPAAAPGASGRLRPARVFGLVTSVALLVVIGLLAFGGDNGPFAALTSDDDTQTPLPTLTEVVVVPTTVVPEDTPGELPTFPVRATETPRPTNADAVSEDTPSAAPEDTNTPTPNSAPVETQIPESTEITPVTQFPADTPSLTPTLTQTPSHTPPPTIDVTGTAAANLFATRAAASPTPNMTLTLQACDFEYIVIAPEDFDVPPASNSNNDRLVRYGLDFTFQIVLRNTGNCAWPEGTRLSFNRELTANPNEEIDLQALADACTNTVERGGLNFAEQQQSNFLLDGTVEIAEESEPITFTGIAPDLFGCYYGVWDLLYPGSNLPIGRPLLLAIRVWGSG